MTLPSHTENTIFSASCNVLQFSCKKHPRGLDTFLQDAITPLASGAKPNAPRISR